MANQPDSVDEQKAALRALVTVSKRGAVTLSVQNGEFTVNGEVLPQALTGIQELLNQFNGHAVREMVIEVGALPADVLGTARVLATVAAKGDEGREIDAKLRALALRTVRVTFQQGTKKGEADPVTVNAFTTARPSRNSIGVDAADDLVLQLDEATSVNVASRLLDQIVAQVESNTRSNKSLAAAEAMAKVVAREAACKDADLKRAYGSAIRRLCKPTSLRAVASVMPRRKERTEEFLAVLARAGDEGAEALIEQLMAAQSLSERRIYFDALVRLKVGAATLIHMLGDPRWYVARNSADLLGELNAMDADVPLSEVLKHEDDRVRRAAAHALGKLGTAHAVVALRKALKDSSAHVRALAAAGLANRRGSRSAGTLVHALDTEPDLEVQIAILGALGRVANAEAVHRLIKAAEPAGGLFKRKPVPFRVAAVQGLGEARTPAAMAALKDLAADKDKEVRQAAVRAIAHAEPAEPTTLT